MPNHSKPEKKKSSRSSEDIQVPPIPKQTAGAVTGAAIGSIAGPVGAVVGGVVGALAGKAASSGRPVRNAVRRATAVSKGALKRQSVKKSPTKSRKSGGRRYAPRVRQRTRSRKSSGAKSQKRTVRAPRKLISLGKNRHHRVRGKNAVAVARKDVRTLVLFVSFRVAAKTVCERAQFARWSFIFAEKPCGHRRFHRRRDRKAMPIARPNRLLWFALKRVIFPAR